LWAVTLCSNATVVLTPSCCLHSSTDPCLQVEIKLPFVISMLVFGCSSNPGYCIIAALNPKFAVL